MTLLTFKYPKARKTHECQVCGCDIPKGTVHHYQTGAYDGSVSAWRAHSDCAEMHWHHNKGRDESDQVYDYLGYGYRGRWPHAVCRLELRQQIAEMKRRAARAVENVSTGECGI